MVTKESVQPAATKKYYAIEIGIVCSSNFGKKIKE